jgi:hypothetical protein
MDIEKLKRLAESATPGPWVVGACYADNGQVTVYGIYNQEGRDVFSEDGISEPDADYIAAANPAAVLELIRQGKELAKQVAEWERLSRNWLASQEAAQRLSGYRDLARKASDACDAAEKLQAELLVERARLDFVLTKAIALYHGQLTWTDEDMRTHFVGICEGEDARSIIDYLWMEDAKKNATGNTEKSQ